MARSTAAPLEGLSDLFGKQGLTLLRRLPLPTRDRTLLDELLHYD